MGGGNVFFSDYINGFIIRIFFLVFNVFGGRPAGPVGPLLPARPPHKKQEKPKKQENHWFLKEKTIKIKKTISFIRFSCFFLFFPLKTNGFLVFFVFLVFGGRPAGPVGLLFPAGLKIMSPILAIPCRFCTRIPADRSR